MAAPVFTPAELAAMVGYQLDPGHSDLDNEQPMSVRVHDGWDARWLPCRLGDIRKAQRDFHARLQGDLKRDLVLSLMLGLLREWEAVDAGAWHPVRHANDKADLLARTKDAITQAEKLGGAK